MREIKFRAWDKEKKIMIRVDGINFALNRYWGQEHNSHIKHDFSLEPYEFMQFTGLKDKNGKEIWEGDIVLYAYDEDEDLQKYQVKWEAAGFWLLYLDGKYPEFEFDPFTQDDGKDMEVIGNIYENSELLI